MSGIREHLEKCIIPFWKGLIDEKNGGFFGKVTNDLVINKEDNKSLIAHARYLFTFSLWYKILRDDTLIPYMDHSYHFIKQAFYDHEFGGYHWMVDYQGKPIDSTKHVYGQAFVIYALAEYGEARSRQDVLDEAFRLFWLIDQHAYHEGCHYNEQFKRDWQPINNGLLAAHGMHLPYTTNTLLHLLEGYTNLYRVRQDEMLKERILGLLKGFNERLYNEKDHSFYMYLDEKRFVAPIGKSYGHDIESCWLIDKSLEVLKLHDEKIKRMTHDVAQSVYEKAMTPKGLISEKINGDISQDRIWWIQVEAMVGFFNHYQKTNDLKYLQATKDLYQFIQNHLVDPREHSEWFWGIDKDGKPITDHGIAEAWKAPYHNGRALIELMKRGFDK